MKEVNFKLIPLQDLSASPTNPRKNFDQSKTTELAQSIKEKGVLQPILVREKGNKYEIICGERRFRASKLVHAADKTKGTIPAIVRDMSDQEVRELQLIENFQREDVHPMEEALAIKYAIETGQYSTEDLCAKVGKSDFYIKQRIKLNNLSERLQKLFYNGNLNITNALKFAVYSHEIQDEIIDDDHDFDGLMKDPSEKVELNKWDVIKYTGKLSEAKFDIKDKDLVKDMGACTNCKFNTGVALLFPEDAGTARCTNISCFKTKTDLSLQLEIEKAKEDPSIVFVCNNWSKKFDNSKLCNALISAGHEIYTRDAFSELDKPELDTWEEYKENRGWDTSDEEERAKIEQDYKDDTNQFQGDLKGYTEKIASGKYTKALIVDGDERGKYIYVQLSGKKSSISTQAGSKVDVKAEGITIADIDAEIARIKEKNNRSKQIDENKMWEELKKQFNPQANSSVLKGEFTGIERKAIAQSLYNKLDYMLKDTFRKQFKWESSKKNGGLPEVSEEQLRQMTRFFFLSVLPPSVLYYGFKNSDEDLQLSMEIAKAYFPNVLTELEEKYAAAAEKRQKNTDKKLSELQAKKKELKPKKAAAASKK